MGELFGPVTPFVLMAIITGITEFAKRNWELEGKHVQLVALAVSLVLIGSYHILQADPFDAWAAYSAIIYSLLGWLTSIGLYEAGSQWLVKRQ